MLRECRGTLPANERPNISLCCCNPHEMANQEHKTKMLKLFAMSVNMLLMDNAAAYHLTAYIHVACVDSLSMCDTENLNGQARYR